MKRFITSSAVFCLCSSPVLAQAIPATPIQPALAQPATQASPEKTLAVGDKAPAVELTHVLKGEAVEEFEPGHVYVVEFWATWCPPCRTSMPHLTDVQAEYPEEVTIIGISDENLQTVVDFLQKTDDEGKSWFEKIDYTLVTDPDESAYTDYMRAAGQRGIPTAFIVGKDAHVEWIGHPMSMDKPLEEVVKGTWDRDAYAADFKKKKEQEAAARAIMGEVQSAETPEEIRTVLGKIDGVLADYPDNLNLQLIKYDLLLKRLKDDDKAIACGEQIARDNWDSSGLLNSISWNTITTEDISKSIKVAATRWAARADELTEGKDASIIDTLARCYYEQGDLAKAIELQTKAVQVADPGMKKSLKDTLDKYEAELDKA